MQADLGESIVRQGKELRMTLIQRFAADTEEAAEPADDRRENERGELKVPLTRNLCVFLRPLRFIYPSSKRNPTHPTQSAAVIPSHPRVSVSSAVTYSNRTTTLP